MSDSSATPDRSDGAVSTGGDTPPPSSLQAGEGTYCPRCGFLVHFDLEKCPGCGHVIYHQASKVQRVGLLAALGFIILGGFFVFIQPRAHDWRQDVVECGIIACVIGAGIGFFMAVVDMVRRGGE